MTDIDTESLLSEAEVLQLPWYARGRKLGRAAARTTVMRNRKHGRLAPDGTRKFLRGIRTAGGTFYRRADVDAFFRAINGFDDDDAGAGDAAALPRANPPLPGVRAADVDAAEAEFLAAASRPKRQPASA